MDRVVRLAAEYGCFPLWLPTDSGVDNIPSSALPISEALAAEVQCWSEEYEVTYDPDDPLNSGFSSTREKLAFTEKGRSIAQRLAEELGPGWRVLFLTGGGRSRRSEEG